MIQLRDYQKRGFEELREGYRQGFKALLYVLATGGGKTHLFSYVAWASALKGNRTTIITHRQEIMQQIQKTLREFGQPFGIISKGKHIRSDLPVLVASVKTLANRLDVIPAPDLLVIDESHHARASTYGKIIARYKDSKILGVTATPCRTSGEGLGEIFDKMILGPSTAQLTAEGFLSKAIYFAPPCGVDTSALKIVRGDFNLEQSEDLMDRPSIIGSAVEHYRKICDGVPALAFCVSLKHAASVTAQFKEAGYRAEMVDGEMDDDLRISRTEGLRNGSVQILVSCELIGEGYDCPGAVAAILLRPTASLSLHLQQIGRVLRPMEGKANAFVIDAVGNCLRHGLAETPREWTLDGRIAQKRAVGEEPMHSNQCPKCYAVFAPAPWCPQCGHELPVKSRKIATKGGDLAQVTAEQVEAERVRVALRMEVGMAKDFKSLLAIEKARGYKNGWAYQQWRFRRKRGPSTATPSAPMQQEFAV